MAYRSDVKIVMKKADFVDLLFKMDELNEETAYNKDLLDYAEQKDTPQNGVILSWDYIKWDESTDEAVEYIMNYLSELKSPYRFIRIGEGYGTDTDIEEYDHYEDVKDLDFINQINWRLDITEHIIEEE